MREKRVRPFVVAARCARQCLRQPRRFHAKRLSNPLQSVLRKSRPCAEFSEHRARLNGGELVLVTQHHESRVRRNGIEQMRRHRDVDHRRLVDHDDVIRQRIVAMMPEAPARPGTEQPMQGVRRLRQARGEFGGQIAGTREQGFLHPLRSFTGRRRQGNPQIGLRIEQAGEHTDHRRRLAGARAAADDGQPPGQRHDCRDTLPVDLVVLRRAEVAQQTRVQRLGCGVRVCFCAASPSRMHHQRARETPLVVVVARQIQAPLPIDHQRPQRRRAWRTVAGHAACE